MASNKRLVILAAAATASLIFVGHGITSFFYCQNNAYYNGKLQDAQNELKYAKQTIERLKKDLKQMQNGQTRDIEGCSPGSLTQLHKHVDAMGQYCQRAIEDHQDDMRVAMQNAKKIKEISSNADVQKAVEDIIHTFRYRFEPDYGIPYGRKKYYSAEGEGGIDRMAEIFVGSNKNGVYLETGEPSGLSGNTRLFDVVHGWKGVIMEAGKSNYLSVKKNRPHADVYRVALWNQTGKLVDITQGGNDPAFNQQSGAGLVTTCVPLQTGEQPPSEMNDAAPCYPMDELLAGNVGHVVTKSYGAFDYVSLDCEGCEIYIVEQWDFKANPSKIFTIEWHNERTPPPVWRRIVDIMRTNGYVWYTTFFDCFFINTRLLYGIEPDAFNLRTIQSKDKISWTQ